MDMINVILMATMLCGIQATYNTTVYQNHHSDGISSPMFLLRCARTKAKIASLVGIRLNPSTDLCVSLYRSWLANKNVATSDHYMTIASSDEMFDPPALPIAGGHAYQRNVPIEIQDGSSVDIYFSTPLSTVQIVAIFRKVPDYIIMAVFKYATSQMTVKYRYDYTFSTEIVNGVTLTVDKIEKFTFTVDGEAVQIYHDDQWLTSYYDPTNPLTPADISNLVITSSGAYRVHQIIYHH